MVAATGAAVMLDVALLRWVLIGLVWSMLVSYLAVLVTGSEKPHVRHVPVLLEFVVDLAVMALLIYAKWYATAAAFVASAVVLDAIYQRDEKSRRRDDAI
jgi:hypothetical protein